LYSEQLLGISGILGQELRKNELLNNIKQRCSIAGGTCDFDLPMLHYWLEHSIESRHLDLKNWLQTIRPVRVANDLLINLIRESANPKQEIASNGFFQQTLDTSNQYQMIRIGVSKEYKLFPEISGGRHRFSVRFMEPATTHRPKQASEKVNFQLALCGL
jgi:cell division protein ZapD